MHLEFRSACLPGSSHLRFLLRLHYSPTRTLWRLIGLDGQGGSPTWLAGFAGSWLRAQLGLPTEACLGVFFMCSWTLHTGRFELVGLLTWQLRGIQACVPGCEAEAALTWNQETSLSCMAVFCKWVRSRCRCVRQGIGPIFVGRTVQNLWTFKKTATGDLLSNFQPEVSGFMNLIGYMVKI